MSTAPRVSRNSRCAYHTFQDIAKGLCLAAYWRSLQSNVDTPFARSVRADGGARLGGKPDDISVSYFFSCHRDIFCTQWSAGCGCLGCTFPGKYTRFAGMSERTAASGTDESCRGVVGSGNGIRRSIFVKMLQKRRPFPVYPSNYCKCCFWSRPVLKGPVPQLKINCVKVDDPEMPHVVDANDTRNYDDHMSQWQDMHSCNKIVEYRLTLLVRWEILLTTVIQGYRARTESRGSTQRVRHDTIDSYKMNRHWFPVTCVNSLINGGTKIPDLGSLGMHYQITTSIDNDRVVKQAVNLIFERLHRVEKYAKSQSSFRPYVASASGGPYSWHGQFVDSLRSYVALYLVLPLISQNLQYLKVLNRLLFITNLDFGFLHESVISFSAFVQRLVVVGVTRHLFHVFYLQIMQELSSLAARLFSDLKENAAGYGLEKTCRNEISAATWIYMVLYDFGVTTRNGIQLWLLMSIAWLGGFLRSSSGASPKRVVLHVLFTAYHSAELSSAMYSNVFAPGSRLISQRVTSFPINSNTSASSKWAGSSRPQ
eukprot:284817850_5